MATIQKNSPWHDKIEVQKGDFGEELFQKYLEAQNNIIYRPGDNGAHGFDMLGYKDEKYFAVEVKTKPMCRKYPETGFSKRLFDRYRKLSRENNLPVLIAFVDEDYRGIYGNYLSELEKPKVVAELGDKGFYPKYQPHTGGGELTVYFHISTMKHFKNLTDDEVTKLKSFGGNFERDSDNRRGFNRAQETPFPESVLHEIERLFQGLRLARDAQNRLRRLRRVPQGLCGEGVHRYANARRRVNG